jgi:hypothetical protein
MSFQLGVPERQPIANAKDIFRVTREWLAFFHNIVKVLMAGLTGDVTTFPPSTTATITPHAVTFNKIQTVHADKLLGRGHGAGTGDVQEITLGNRLSMTATTLNVDGENGGFVPVSTGAEPLVIVSNGAGSVLLVPYTYSQ